jgi:hypothetical protein
MHVTGLDHVQLAIPPGREDEARRFYAADPFGNRLEFIQDGDGFSQPKG